MKKTFLLLILLFSSFWGMSQPPVVLAALDSCDFETPCGMIIPDSAHAGIWQLGKPKKVIFDSAYSPVNAMITDTLNPYSINQDCYFQVQIPEEGFRSYRLSFYHRFNTDTLIDGGFVEISYDGGQSWYNIINGGVEVENFYGADDILMNNNRGFSGNSNGWIHSSIMWYVQLAKNTETPRILRFHFISDSIETNKEGWMIDNLYLEELQSFGSISEIKNNAFTIHPNPANDFIEINLKEKNTKFQKINIYNLLGQEIKSFRSPGSGKVKLDISELKKGIYFLKVFGDHKGLGSSKWIKN